MKTGLRALAVSFVPLATFVVWIGILFLGHEAFFHPGFIIGEPTAAGYAVLAAYFPAVMLISGLVAKKLGLPGPWLLAVIAPIVATAAIVGSGYLIAATRVEPPFGLAGVTAIEVPLTYVVVAYLITAARAQTYSARNRSV